MGGISAALKSRAAFALARGVSLGGRDVGVADVELHGAQRYAGATNG